MFTKEDVGQMLETDRNFPGEEEEILREIRILPEQMIRILDCLKINKALGPDGIHPRIWKKEEKEGRYLELSRKKRVTVAV